MRRDERAQRGQSRRAVGLGERQPHLGDVGGRVVLVALGKDPAQATRERGADGAADERAAAVLILLPTPAVTV
jgi:hypothetical protein